MKNRLFVLIFSVMICALPVSATVCSFINITQGIPGLDNMTMNMTMNQTFNLTANMTAGNADMTWNTSYCLLSGASEMTGNLSLGGFNISYILDPVAPQDAATRNYIDTFPIINTSYLTVAINNSYDTIENRTANIINSSYLTVAINNSYVTLDNTTYSGQFATTANLSSTNVSGQANLTAYITAVNASASANASAYSVAINTSINTYISTLPIINTSYDTIDNRSANIINSSYLTVAINNSYVTLDNTTYSGAFASTANLSSTNVSGQTNLTSYITTINASVSGNYTSYITTINASISGNYTAYDVAMNTSMQGYVDAVNTSMRNNITSNFAPKVSGKVPTANLGSDTANNTGCLFGDQYWRVPSGYTLYVSHITSSPADSVYNYWGMNPLAPSTSAAARKVPIPRSGIIKEVHVAQNSGTAGTNEAYSLYVDVNGVISNSSLVQTVSAATNIRLFDNTSMSISVTKGQYIEMRFVNPAWATNPLTTISNGYVYIE